MNGAELREASTSEPEIAYIFSLVGCGHRRRLEALLREIRSTVKVDELFGVGLDVIEYLTQQLVGKGQDTMWRRCHCNDGALDLLYILLVSLVDSQWNIRPLVTTIEIRDVVVGKVTR
jgi:hypothetical protein